MSTKARIWRMNETGHWILKVNGRLYAFNYWADAMEKFCLMLDKYKNRQ